MTQSATAGVPWGVASRESAGLRAAQLGAAVVVALILGVAAVAKVTKPDVAVMATEGFFAALPTVTISPKAGVAGWAISFTELVIAALVLVFRRHRATWMGVALLFGAFGGFALQRMLAGRPCGCFGAWNLKPQLSLGLDIVGVGLGLALGGAATTRRGGSDAFAYLATGVAAAAMLGAGAGAMTERPSALAIAEKEGASAIQRLMLLPEMADIRGSRAGDPAWLVYVYNPDCQTCQRHLLGAFQPYADAHPNDESLRVRMVAMDILEDSAGIELWSWEAVPTTFLVQGGIVTERWGDKDIPDPETIRLRITDSRREGQGDGILKLMRLPMMQDIVNGGPNDPSWLVYVYNPDCPLCLTHLSGFRQFMDQAPEDPTLRVRIFSMQDLEHDHNIAMHDWATVPTAALFHDGVMRKLYPYNEVPDPFELWTALQK